VAEGLPCRSSNLVHTVSHGSWDTARLIAPGRRGTIVRRRSGTSLVAVVALALTALFVAVAQATGPEVLVAGDAHGLAMARGHAGPKGGGGNVQNLQFHSGTIMTSAVVQAIYWGPSWGNPAFVGDKQSGLTTFYDEIGGSSYIHTNTEYTGTNGTVGTSVSHGPDAQDLSSTPSKDPGTSGVLAEVARKILSPVANGYYPVYTDIPRGSANYCAWHSWGAIGSTPVQFAFFFKLDGDSGCDPGDTSTGHSEGLAALANVSGHELSEALTDPRGAGWFDRRGAENADKCAWTFSGLESFGKSSWKIQGNWSNAAANSRSGYANVGCITSS
jgi:hypothetical protein